MQPQNKGPGMLWGQSYVLPMTWGGGGIWGAPFGRHAALRLFHFESWPMGRSELQMAGVQGPP